VQKDLNLIKVRNGIPEGMLLDVGWEGRG